MDFPAILAKLKANRRKAGLVVFGVIAGILALWSAAKLVFSEENQEAGLAIVVATERYKGANGARCPEKLTQLPPKFIDTIPQPVKDTNFVYGTSSDRKQCWFGYQIFRGVVNEYDFQDRKWRYAEYGDSDALRMMNKEFVMGPK